VKNITTYVGVDAHKKDLFIAMLVGNQTTPVTWQLANEPKAVRRLVRKLERDAPGPVRLCYEAGPCGYALQRQMTTARVSCQVIAPALIPRKPGERIKTNRRDARKLAELLRAGLLTEVRPPTPEEEAVRDLCRARDDAREDFQRCRHRLGKLLLRRGLHYSGRNWTRAHRQWIDSLEWTQPAERVVVADYLLAIDHLEARLIEFDARLTELAQTEPYREPVGWLRCFRGVDTLTAILILAELHDFRRFHTPRALMAYLGLVPGEDSSGEKHRRGRITRTGNALVRRLLVETAWHYQHRPGIGVALTRRRKGQPGRVIAIADKAQQRLCRRFRRLAEQHKPAAKIAVAIARELAGFLWAALQPVATPARRPTCRHATEGSSKQMA
jgi:transposase